MTNKMWRKRIAILLAGSMLTLQFPAAAEDMSGSGMRDIKTEASSENEKPAEPDAEIHSASEGSYARESAETSETSEQKAADVKKKAPSESMAAVSSAYEQTDEDCNVQKSSGDSSAADESGSGGSAVAETDAGSRATEEENAGGSTTVETHADGSDADVFSVNESSSAEEVPSGIDTVPAAADHVGAVGDLSKGNFAPTPEDDSFQCDGEGSGTSLESTDAQTSIAAPMENEIPSGSSMENQVPSEAAVENQVPSEAAMENQTPSGSSMDNQIPSGSFVDNQELSGTENCEAQPGQSDTIPERESQEEVSDAVAPSNEKGETSDIDTNRLSMRYMNQSAKEQKGVDAPDGNEISHVMPGEVVREYFAPAEDGSITTAMASVSWKGDDNTLYDIRPGSLTVRLQKSTDGGETYDEGTSYELNEENEWKVLLEDLPTTEDGKEITYRWVWNIDEAPDGSPLDVENSNEYNLPGYLRTQDEASEDGLESRREYTYETHQEKYVLSMNWDDMGDLNATLPDKIEIILPDGSTVELSAENNWMAEVSLPVTNRDLSWKLSAADGWVPAGSMAEYDEEDNSTVITFNRRWATEDTTQTREEEVPVGYSTLTVQYWIGSTEAAPSFVGVYENGQKYNVSVPKVTGYSAQVTRVKGKIDEDTIVNVRYVANTYQVTVYYRYLNGETAAPASTQEVKTGSSYSIASPQLDGYTANIEAVSGTVTGRDLTYIVYYTGVEPGNNNGEGRENEQVIIVPGTAPTQPEEEFETIDDYKTALGLGEVGINAGECFE